VITIVIFDVSASPNEPVIVRLPSSLKVIDGFLELKFQSCDVAIPNAKFLASGLVAPKDTALSGVPCVGAAAPAAATITITTVNNYYYY